MEGVGKMHNLVNHDKHASLCVLGALDVAVDDNAEPVVEAAIAGKTVRRDGSAVGIENLWAEQEDIGSRILGELVKMFEHTGGDEAGAGVDDQLDVDVDMDRALRGQTRGMSDRGGGDKPMQSESL